MSFAAEKLVYDYLTAVSDLTHGRVPTQQRTSYVAGLRKRIEAARSGLDADDEAGVARVLKGLGSPADRVSADLGGRVALPARRPPIPAAPGVVPPAQRSPVNPFSGGVAPAARRPTGPGATPAPAEGIPTGAQWGPRIPTGQATVGVAPRRPGIEPDQTAARFAGTVRVPAPAQAAVRRPVARAAAPRPGALPEGNAEGTIGGSVRDTARSSNALGVLFVLYALAVLRPVAFAAASVVVLVHPRLRTGSKLFAIVVAPALAMAGRAAVLFERARRSGSDTLAARTHVQHVLWPPDRATVAAAGVLALLWLARRGARRPPRA